MACWSRFRSREERAHLASGCSFSGLSSLTVVLLGFSFWFFELNPLNDSNFLGFPVISEFEPWFPLMACWSRFRFSGERDQNLAGLIFVPFWASVEVVVNLLFWSSLVRVFPTLLPKASRTLLLVVVCCVFRELDDFTRDLLWPLVDLFLFSSKLCFGFNKRSFSFLLVCFVPQSAIVAPERWRAAPRQSS